MRMRLDDAGHRITVGNAKSGQFQEGSLCHHLLRMRGPFEKREVRSHSDLAEGQGVVKARARVHAKTPCIYQSGAVPPRP